MTNSPSGSVREEIALVREQMARALHDFERTIHGRRRSPAWENELPEYRDHMRDKADAILPIIAAALEKEREECAKVADQHAGREFNPGQIAAAIRARTTRTEDSSHE